MAQAVPRRAVRGAFAERRRQIERRLAGLGPARQEPEPRQEAQALRSALESLGPVFAAFGAYLASRPDLLPLGDCLELAAIAVRAEPTPPDGVHERITAELGTVDGIFSSLDAQPFRCRLMTQWHRARLRDGRPVVLELVHSDLEKRLGFDLELLSMLAPALSCGERLVPKQALAAAAADFAAGLRRQADFLAELQALVALRESTDGSALVTVPAVVAPLSRPKLLCLEDLPEGSGDLLPGTERARRLWLAWLRLALSGPAFPLEMEDLRWLAGGGIGITGGPFAALPPEARTDLLDYLQAAAGDDPGAAAAPLLRQMEALDPAAEREAEAELWRRFRQVVPLRDSGWGSAGRPDLAEHLFVHWRFATGLGLRPRAHLVDFYRGLSAVWAEGRRLDPAGDPLSAALENLRLLTAMERLRDLLDFGQLPRRLEGYAAAMASMPRQLDAALDLAAGNGPALVVRAEEEPGKRRMLSMALVAALLLALAGLALLARRWAVEEAFKPWSDIVSTTLFLVLGGLLLRAIGRPG